MYTINKAIFAGIVLTLSTYCLAIDPNSTLPIEIESDSAVLDDTNGISIYKGNVIISQGLSRLEADSIHVSTNNRQVIEIKAEGQPAHFVQQESSESPLTHGYGDTIKYLSHENLLHLIGDAKIVQEENSFAGEQIEYDILKRAIRAQGDEKQGSRVKIHYQPRVQAPLKTPIGDETKQNTPRQNNDSSVSTSTDTHDASSTAR